jgi:4-carboxymuconolactone decarboxylase
MSITSAGPPGPLGLAPVTAEGERQFDRGMRKFREVYAGDVVELPEGAIPFNDVMQRSLFGEVWDRPALDIRSRRLLIMGVIAAAGQVDTWKIQARAALRRRELTPDELRETLVQLAPYAGYPRVAPLVAATEEVLGTWQAEGEPGPPEEE